ncbi:hypothetical protein, partial [uncultured Parabacteroides sp.]|uniref:hypothetical protein n=1 Tax=uncultured Parabacteroides sp. TaxID=512312 RepID=UPI00262D79DC
SSRAAYLCCLGVLSDSNNKNYRTIHICLFVGGVVVVVAIFEKRKSERQYRSKKLPTLPLYLLG